MPINAVTFDELLYSLSITIAKGLFYVQDCFICNDAGGNGGVMFVIYETRLYL